MKNYNMPLAEVLVIQADGAVMASGELRLIESAPGNDWDVSAMMGK